MNESFDPAEVRTPDNMGYSYHYFSQWQGQRHEVRTHCAVGLRKMISQGKRSLDHGWDKRAGEWQNDVKVVQPVENADVPSTEFAQGGRKQQTTMRDPKRGAVAKHKMSPARRPSGRVVCKEKRLFLQEICQGHSQTVAKLRCIVRDLTTRAGCSKPAPPAIRYACSGCPKRAAPHTEHIAIVMKCFCVQQQAPDFEKTIRKLDEEACINAQHVFEGQLAL